MHRLFFVTYIYVSYCMDSEDHKSKLDLKQHQRFKREVPWGLIRKIVIVGVMGILVYYLIQNIENTNKPTENQNGFEVEIE